MTTHELKTVAPFFDLVRLGTKRFEIRQDDRGYAEGDTLVLREWQPEDAGPTPGEPARYTGRSCRVKVLYLLRLVDLDVTYPALRGMLAIAPLNLVILSIAGLPDAPAEGFTVDNGFGAYPPPGPDGPTRGIGTPQVDRDEAALAELEDRRELVEARMRPGAPAGSREWLAETEARLDAEKVTAAKVDAGAFYGGGYEVLADGTERVIPGVTPDARSAYPAPPLTPAEKLRVSSTYGLTLEEAHARLNAVQTEPGPCAAMWQGERCNKLARAPHPSGVAGAKICAGCLPKVLANEAAAKRAVR